MICFRRGGGVGYRPRPLLTIIFTYLRHCPWSRELHTLIERTLCYNRWHVLYISELLHKQTLIRSDHISRLKLLKWKHGYVWLKQTRQLSMISKGVSCADLERGGCWGVGPHPHPPSALEISNFLNSYCNIPENRPRSPSGKRNYPSNPLPLEKKLDPCVCLYLADKYQQGQMEETNFI